MAVAGASKKQLYMSETIGGLNALLEKKLQDMNWTPLRESLILDDFNNAKEAMRNGDEELAYISFSQAIRRYIRIQGYIENIGFSDSQQDECLRFLDELSKSLIRRYKVQSVSPLKNINTLTSSHEISAKKVMLKPIHKPKSTGFFAKIKRLFSGKSPETVRFTAVEPATEALPFAQKLSSTRDNGDDEIRKIMQRHEYYNNKVDEIRRRNKMKKVIGPEATRRNETSNEDVKQKRLQQQRSTAPLSQENLSKASMNNIHAKLHFSGFPPQCTEAFVLKFFNSYGNVEKFIPSKLTTGQFKGSGVIEYKTRVEAEKALKSATGVIITGHRISVTFFNEQKNEQRSKAGFDYANLHPLIKIVPKSKQEIEKSANNHDSDRSSHKREQHCDNRVLFVKFSTQDILNEDKLRSLFAKFGNIRYANIARNVNKSHTSFGKVCFYNAEHTNTAILEMNNYTFSSGKKLFVSRYRFNTSKADNGNVETKRENNQSHNASNECDFTNIYVKNFKDLYRDETELSAAFLKFGTIKSARVMRDNQNESLGWGFVCFYNHCDAHIAVEQMNNTVIHGHRLFVRRAYNNYDKKNKLRNQFLQKRTNQNRANEYYGAKSKVVQTCIVCFTENASSESCVLECEHVICKECIVLYIQHLIDNKEVESIICPKDGCQCELSFIYIKRMIPSDLLKEYDRCLVDNYLNKRDDIVWCPKAECRCPVFVTKNQTEGRCPKCKFAFCTKCGEKYHGIFACNAFKSEEEKKRVVTEYMYGNGTEKAELERKYTKKKLEKEVEDVLSNQCIKTKCKQCPNCKVNIEKNEGCNKIICTKCKCYFCWLCLHILDQSDPYKHFNESGSRCILLPRHLLM